MRQCNRLLRVCQALQQVIIVTSWLHVTGSLCTIEIYVTKYTTTHTGLDMGASARAWFDPAQYAWPLYNE